MKFNNCEHWTKKFDSEWDYNQKVNCGSPNYKLYLSKEEIINEGKADKLYDKIKSCFNNYSNNNEFTLDELNKILDIINENKERID